METVISVNIYLSIVDYKGCVSQALLCAVALLLLQTSLFGTPRRPGLQSALGYLHRPADQMGQSLARLLPVSLPRAEGMSSDNKHSIFGQALSRDLHQTIFNLWREGNRPLDVETQLDAGRSFIYMLPSRAGRLDVMFREFPFVEEDRLSYTHKDLI